MFAFLSNFKLIKLVSIVCFSKEKSIKVYKYIDLTVEVYEEYFKISFFRWESPSEFNRRHSLKYTRGRGRSNRMAVHVREGAVIWSFWFVHSMYQNYRRLIIYRFQIHLLLLVYKLYSFFCFGFSNIWKNTLTCIMWVIQEACY